ncbi:MAG: acyl-CoA reductase [Bacteroidia bacterium]
MNLKQRTEAFVQLGHIINFYLGNSFDDNDVETDKLLNNLPKINQVIEQAYYQNGWFTKDNVHKSLFQIAQMLQKKELEQWLNSYTFKDNAPKNIGIIMAGNIPMVGFHDLLCVLLSGNKAIVRLSSQDKLLIPLLTDFLIEIEPQFQNYIFFTETPFKSIHAIIATGSNNSARYFEHYFSNYPHIIRKNRNSIAVLDGSETENDLYNLGSDIFTYFGLGCRNVSKIYVPEQYNFDKFFNAIYDFNPVINNKKYGNNYDYNKTIYLLNKEKLLDNGFLILKQDTQLTSPVGVLFYEYYADKTHLETQLINIKEQLQCVVANQFNHPAKVNFGETQSPKLSDYADGIDTMNFLLSL